MAGRQNEAIAIWPGGVLRIELKMLFIEHGGDISHAHWHSGMARICSGDCIQCKGTNGTGVLPMV